MLNFEEKVVFITGSGGGFGRVAAERFAARGARLLLADIDPGRLESTRDAVQTAGAECVTVACDVSDEDAVRDAVAQARAHLGGLDIAVNNAGITHSIVKMAELDTAELDRQLAVNVRGVFLCMKYEIPVMMEQGGGVILNVSSVAGLTGAYGLSAYSASKHAVIGLTKSAAVEYASRGIRINALCPATIDSPLMEQTTKGTRMSADMLAANIPMKRLGTMEEVADAMLWLCSAENSFMTGHAVALDGGFTAQ